MTEPSGQNGAMLRSVWDVLLPRRAEEFRVSTLIFIHNSARQIASPDSVNEYSLSAYATLLPYASSDEFWPNLDGFATEEGKARRLTYDRGRVGTVRLARLSQHVPPIRRK